VKNPAFAPMSVPNQSRSKGGKARPTGLSTATKLSGSLEGARHRHNLYTIENSKGSQVYLNRQDLDRALILREEDVVHAMMVYGPQIPPELVRDYLWFGHTGARA
jgi:hypothetical protein